MISIADFINDCNDIIKGIDNFISRYIGSSLLRKCGITKIVDEKEKIQSYSVISHPLSRLIGNVNQSEFLEKCVSAKKLLFDKLLLCFYPGSAYRMFSTDTFYSDYKKDTFYRFDKMPKANWEKLQLNTAANVIKDVVSRVSENCAKALVFDDSLYARTRGKGTELCGKVFDHNDHKMRLGFRMMTSLWTNSETSIPVEQCLLTTRKEELMVGIDNECDARTLCGKRRLRAKEKGPDVVFSMVKNAQKLNIPFDVVLFDTWFSSPVQLIDLKEIDVSVIAMIKKNSTKYTVHNALTGEDETLNVKQIYSRNKKRRGMSRYLLSVNVMVPDKSGRSISAKLVYARNHSNRKEWVCFVCTETGMDEELVLRYYSMRWNIETYFKVAKNYLKLRNECHSTNYDAITSHMVIVAIRYMILATEKFNNNDLRTLEEIFYQVQREVINEMMTCSIIFLLDSLLGSVRYHFQAKESQIETIINNFILGLPTKWKNRFIELGQSA